MTDEAFARAQAILDTRAIELAASANALITHHLVECRDRYLALHGLIVKATCGLMTLLFAIIGYLLTKGGVPGLHP